VTTFQPHIWHPDERIEVPVRSTRIVATVNASRSARSISGSVKSRIVYGEWADPQYAPLPGELVTRELLDLNLHDDDLWDAGAVLRFVDTYGVIEPVEPDERTLHRMRGWELLLDAEAFDFGALFKPLRAVARLARHWITYKRGGNVLDVWYPDRDFDADEVADRVEDCHLWFAKGMEERTAYTRAHFTVGTSWGSSVGLPAPDLIDALSIQLLELCFLHKDFRLPLLDCANENCHYSFFRQRGGKLQHRNTGSKYCSRACAQAVAARASRRRRKDAET
jgi:hypothetical protein